MCEEKVFCLPFQKFMTSVYSNWLVRKVDPKEEPSSLLACWLLIFMGNLAK